MSLPEQEAQALEAVYEMLLALGSGRYKVTSIADLRAEARRHLKHYPLAAGHRWMEAYGDKPEHRRTAARDEEDT